MNSGASSSADLKYRARDVLRASYWPALGAIIVVSLLTNGPGAITSRMEITTSQLLSNILNNTPFMMILGILAALVAYKTLVGNILEIGLARFFICCRYNSIYVSEIFHGFSRGYFNRVKTMLVRDLYLFLLNLVSLLPTVAGYSGWIKIAQTPYMEPTAANALLLLSLLLSIPAIVVGYRWYMIPYILANNPEVTTKRAFDMSRQMMKGDKLNFFVLRLSFLGWAFLGVLACGIGVLFVIPYISAADAEFYADMRQKALRINIGTKEELDGDLSEMIERYESYEREQWQSRAQAARQPAPQTKNCPSCTQPMPMDAKFCNQCGMNVLEKEEETKKERREKLDSSGIKALLEDEKVFTEAQTFLRCYGKNACRSYLQGKAKECGVDDIEISDEDIKDIFGQ